jgi:hypothetical protein
MTLLPRLSDLLGLAIALPLSLAGTAIIVLIASGGVA